MYLVKTPAFVKCLFPHMRWQQPNQAKVLYLTFDDGPIPDVTPWVVEQLARFDAKATFFCVGDNVRKHPDVFQTVIDAGHTVGNHTMHHLNGWQVDHQTYLNDIAACARLVNSLLFRPPYGKIRPGQLRSVARDYQIIMWDVLSGDFDTRISPLACRDYVLQASEPGSIVVFHDSIKAFERLKVALPATLEYFSSKGYLFETLQELDKPPVVKKPSLLSQQFAHKL
jgi:peptidoglycan/xylan/chitin deacetylase (PgdA/CDA1 family)